MSDEALDDDEEEELLDGEALDVVQSQDYDAARLQIIAESWAAANDRSKNELRFGADGAQGEEGSEDLKSTKNDGLSEAARRRKRARRITKALLGQSGTGNARRPESPTTGSMSSVSSSAASTPRTTRGRQHTTTFVETPRHHAGSVASTDTAHTAVPTVYPEMFQFNAEVMGFAGNIWFMEVLAVFDNIVKNIANHTRLQEECDVLAMRIALCTTGPVELADYKACMLASLRSLLPKEWSPAHEVAWTWLWDTVESLLEKNLAHPIPYEAALTIFMESLDEEQKFNMRKDIYTTFFEYAPSGQDFFKQSNTRLHFISERVLVMVIELYRSPTNMVDMISALGLRHVGYGIPTELYGPYLRANVEVISACCEDRLAIDAFKWSLSLITQILVRTVTEGCTIVMQAINANSPKQLRKAIAQAPRGDRAEWMLVVQVGTQSISPLEWAIQSGSLEVAKAMLMDLLTFRADRESYYYGADILFKRHPDIIKILCSDAATLLPTLLDGLIWRSHTTRNGTRRVNYYVRHLVITSDGGISGALKWLAASKDATIISHPVIVLISDTLWKGIVQRHFVYRKVGFIVSLFVFLMTQSILPKFAEDVDSPLWLRITIFAGRLVTYTLGMGRLVHHHAKSMLYACRRGDFAWLLWLPYPKYLQDPYDTSSAVLAILLILMCIEEPMWRCMGDDNWPTEICPANEHEFVYTALSMIAMALHWALLIDMGVFSTKLSAFVLVCGQVMSEVGRFLIALAFLLLTFGSAIACLRRNHPDFHDVPTTMLSLFSITLLMMPRDYRELQDDPALLFAVFLFVTASVILLLNLLIAQLNCSYEYVYQDMVGNARLQRVSVIVETLTTVAERRWQRFTKNLKLDDKIEFHEGDVGLAGAIQVHEPASVNPVTTEQIIRYGGTCSPDMQWPGDKEEEEDRYDRLSRLINRALDRAAKAAHHGGGSNKLNSNSMPSLGTGENSRQTSRDRSHE